MITTAYHGILSGSVSYSDLGFLLARFRTDLPTATVFTAGHNTIATNSSSQTVFAMLWDTSGRGKHQYFTNLNAAPVYDSVNKIALCNGNQLADPLDLGATATTFGILTNVSMVAGGGPFMTVGSINTSNASFGNLTSSFNDETYAVQTNNSPQEFLATTGTAPAGFKFICHTVADASTGTISDSGININGVEQTLILGQKLATNIGSNVRLLSNSAGSGFRFGSDFKEVVYYGTPLNATKRTQLNSIVQR